MLVLSVVFALTWILEVVLYDRIYQSIKTKEIISVSNASVNYFKNDEITELNELTQSQDYYLVIFTYNATNQTVTIVYPQFNDIHFPSLQPNISSVISGLSDKSYIQLQDDVKDFTSLIIGQKITKDGETYYVMLNGTVSPTGSTTDVLTLLLFIITLASVGITILLSVFLSRSVTQPLEEMSKKAQQLSLGNLDIRFNENDYLEVQNLSSTLNYAIEEIKKSQTLQKEVIQNVSHELRTPLTMIESYTQLLQEFSAKDETKRQEHLAIILEESKKLEQLINDMIDLSKLQAHNMRYNDELFSLSASLNKFETYYKTKFEPQGYHLQFEYPKNCFIFADKNRMEQVISNFINNAINYSFDKKPIAIQLKKTDDTSYQFSVQDHGIGIDKAEQDKIFDRHFRSTSVQRAVVGSGIGLTIVKEILNHYNFKFGFESEKGIGSTFHFTFPAAKTTPQKKLKTAPAEGNGKPTKKLPNSPKKTL